MPSPDASGPAAPDAPVVLITGGAGTLATALAAEFAAHGARVLHPGHADLDVTSPASVDATFSRLERLDILVNNAGVTGDAPFARLSPDDWDRVIGTNLKGAYLCARAAARIMARQRRGHIVQIGSYSALHPPPGQTAYAASKAGLIGLTKSLAREFGTRNLRINCVLPGFLETRMTEPLPAEAKAKALERHVLGRFNTVEEAARFIRLLTTFEHLSGQVFQLDSRA